MNKYLEKIATELKEPANPASLGFDLSKGEEKELYKWLTAVTLFSRPIQRSVATMAAKHMANEGFHSPEAVEAAGWETLRDNLVKGHYARFDESTATTMLAQAKHLKEKYGTIGNLIDSRTPEEIRAEIQTFRGIGPLGSQLFVEGINPYLSQIQKSASIEEEFNPDLTPQEMEELGVLAAQYYGKDPKEANFFHTDASLRDWPNKWIDPSAPLGWFDWYKGYASGRRTSDDERQIKRWKSFKARHLGSLKKADPTLKNLSIQPKRRQALLNWGITAEMTKDELIAKAKEIEKKAFIEDYVRHKYVEKDWTQLDHPVASKKWDGAHFVADIMPDGKIRFFSRRPSVKGGYPERTAQLPHITDTLIPEYAGNRFAVELVHTGKEKTEKESHPTVSGILNSKVERSISTQAEKGPVRAVLIDVKNPELPTYKDKIEYLQKLEKDFGKSDVMFAPHLEHGVENINKYLTRIKDQGGEGLIVADYESPETESVRYKVKNFNTYNLRVIGLQQEIDIHGNPKNSMGALLLEDATRRMVGKVGTGFDRATRIDAWKNPQKWKGRMIQIKAYPPSVPGGQVRFPIYNGDADGEIDTI